MDVVSAKTPRTLSESPPHLTPLFESALRAVLKIQKVVQGRFIDRLMIRAFGGVHPKNVFHYRTVMYLPYLKPTDRVMDLASGSGITLSRLAPRIAAGLGIEYNHASVEGANTRNTHPHIRYQLGDILTFDYADLQRTFLYSVAIYSHILEHLDDPVALLKKVAAPRIIICVPSEDNWYRQLLLFLKMDHRSDPTHRCEYREHTLRQMIVDAGYTPLVLAYNSEGELFSVADRTT